MGLHGQSGAVGTVKIFCSAHFLFFFKIIAKFFTFYLKLKQFVVIIFAIGVHFAKSRVQRPHLSVCVCKKQPAATSVLRGLILS